MTSKEGMILVDKLQQPISKLSLGSFSKQVFFIHMQIKLIFMQIKAPSLVLKKRPKVIQKWPIKEIAERRA